MPTDSNTSKPADTKSVGWEFIPVSPRGHHTSTRDENHFYGEEGNQLAAPLVRETGQNTKDAQAGTEPAVLSLRLVKLGAQGAQCLHEMFRPVQAHWDGLGEGGDNPLDDLLAGKAKASTVLVIEDWHTTGLLGALDSNELDGGFSSMMRWSGASAKSVKGGPQGGLFGLGKATIPASSKARCYFVFTERHEDAGNPVFMGKAMLPVHRVDGVVYEGAAFYYHDLLDGVGPELPFRGASATELARCLGVDRRGMPGTSIIIPWPADGMDEQALATAAARNFFHHITCGLMAVEVGGRRLDAASIGDLLRDEPELLARQHLSEAFNDQALVPFHLDIAEAGSYKVEDILGDGQLTRMREDWRRGRTVVVGASFPFSHKNKSKGGHGEVDVVYAINPRAGEATSVDAGRPMFIRRGVMLKTSQGRLRAGVSVAEVVSDRASAFLAGYENPAHTLWKKPSKVAHADLLAAVVELPMLLERACAPGQRHTDVRSALTEFFRVSLPDKGRTDEGQRRTQRTKTPLPLPLPLEEPASAGKSESKYAPLRFDIIDIPGSAIKAMEGLYEGGVFRLRGALSPKHAGTEVKLMFTYKVNKAEANFRKHDPRDFDITKSAVDIEGGEILARTPNSITIRFDWGDFAMKVHGFHEHRALECKSITMPSRKPSEEEI